MPVLTQNLFPCESCSQKRLLSFRLASFGVQSISVSNEIDEQSAVSREICSVLLFLQMAVNIILTLWRFLCDILASHQLNRAISWELNTAISWESGVNMRREYGLKSLPSP